MKTQIKQQLTLAALASATLVTASCASNGELTRKPNTQAAVYTRESDGNGFNTKSYFYDNGEEVVAFDTQFTPAAAEKSIEFLRTKTQNPITYVVVTHPNPDKFNGMSVFQKLGAQVIASRETAAAMPGVHAYKKYFFVNIAKMFTEESYPKLSQADILFDGSYDLRLKNGETVRVEETGVAGVSGNQSVAYIASQNSLIVGDLIHHNAHAWLEGGIVNGKATPTIESWIENLNRLPRKFPENSLVLGGRGESAVLKFAAAEQIIYLRKAEALVTDYVAKMKNPADLNGDKAGEHYAALTKIFEKTFPKYQLSYMIQYGVYGLAQSKLN